MSKNQLRWVIGFFSVSGLVLIFLFQRIDIASLLNVKEGIYKFIINRSVRFVLNDTLAIGVIYALFAEKKYIVFALWVQLAGIVFFLIPYFVLKFNYPGYNGPLISYLHRLVLNPTLLLLLIPAFYYQRMLAGVNDKMKA